MDTSTKIHEMVQEFVNDSKLFTSVDVGNAIKRKYLNMDVRNKDVALWLRSNSGSIQTLQDYDSCIISVNDGQNQATLYYPHWMDPEDYTTIDQKALSPDDIKELKKKDVSDSVDTDEERKDDSMIDIADVFDDGDQYDPDGKGVKIKKRLKSIDRIWISKSITEAMGWAPGDKVDISKIKIHKGQLNPNLRVHRDGRFCVPRRCINYGLDAVEVILKGDDVFFEKA